MQPDSTQGPLRVVQAVFGVFHHFELAREFERRGFLQKIYSTWPWARLKREGLPRSKVEAFPWLHTPQTLLARTGVEFPRISDQLGVWAATSFDRWTQRRMAQLVPACNVFIGISGAGLLTGQSVQQRGGRFICDRGSTHQRFQEAIVSEEYRRWGVAAAVSDIRDTLREEAIYAQADAITVPSTAAARSFVQMGVSATKVHVIPYGVRLEQFYPVSMPDSARFDVLFAGSVGLRKGVPYLLEAFRALKHPTKRLRLAGAVSAEIRPLLERLPKENVEFLGSVPQNRLRELMSASHVLVLPSVEEGLALVQAQALACGCPVLCSTATGGEDLFTDGVEGFVVAVRDIAALTARMQQLADDPALQRSTRTAALARVRSIGGWTEYGDRWVKLLQDLTASDIHSPPPTK